MKKIGKIISVILILITVLSSLPLTVCAGENQTVFSAFDFHYNPEVARMSGTELELSENGGIPCIHIVAEPREGGYGNGAFSFIVKSSAFHFNVTEYPFAVLGYMTNSKSEGVDATLRYNSKETWNPNGSVIDVIPDGELHKVTFNILDFNAVCEINPDYASIDIIFKLFGSHNIKIDEPYFFDIAYVGFFKTAEEAEAFEYIPQTEEEYLFANEIKTVKKEIIDIDENTLLEYIAKEEALKYDIIHTPNTEFPDAKVTYFVSPNGNDENDGLTPETAWRTLARINKQQSLRGAVVRFERGGIWRERLQTASGVTYSSYGEGAKPTFYGSVPGAGSGKWSETDVPNVWVFSENIEAKRTPGNIVFNGGDAWGIHIFTNGDKRCDQGTVYNGIETVTCPPDAFTGYTDIFKNNFEFWHDTKSGKLYMYSEYGNPGEYFDDMEISLAGSMISGVSTDVTIDNICVMYGGGHGVGAINSENYTVQNCVFAWLGGAGLGNAVQNWDNCKNFTIHHNYAYEIYDCAWTTQSTVTYADRSMVDVTITDNVSERCNTGVEIWLGGTNTDKKGLLENFTVSGNYTMYGGCGWSHQRRADIKDGNFVYGGTGIDEVTSRVNMNFTNNVNIHATHIGLYARYIGPAGFMFDNNVYMMKSGKEIARAASDLTTGGGTLLGYMFTDSDISLLATLGNDVNSTYYRLSDDFTPHTNRKLQDFTDLYGHWGLENISFAVQTGLFSGTEETRFSPSAKMTRAMLVTVLSRLAGNTDTDGRSSFADVDDNAWFAGAVAWGEANGITQNTEKFRPDDNVTREELCDMLYRYAKRFGYDTSKTATLDFADADSISYTDALSFCVANGIIKGYDNNTVSPADEATRAEVATMLKRFIML